MQRFSYVGASYLVLIRDGTLLMQRRANTGFMDGSYGIPSGHLDGGETAREGCVREMREEIGIELEPRALSVVHVMHRKAAHDERIDFFMTTDSFAGEIENKEPDKCDDLSWFPLDALPENTIDYIRFALGEISAGRTYSEWGWQR